MHRARIHLKGVVPNADAAPFGVPGNENQLGTRIKSVRVDRTGRPNPKGTP